MATPGRRGGFFVLLAIVKATPYTFFPKMYERGAPQRSQGLLNNITRWLANREENFVLTTFSKQNVKRVFGGFTF